LAKSLTDDHLLGYITKLREKTLLSDAKLMERKKKRKPKSGVYLLTKSKKDTNNGLDSRL
jgi:hypothetical protein